MRPVETLPSRRAPGGEPTCCSSGLHLDQGRASGMVTQLCGINSAVECQLPKLKVAGSNPVSRSNEVFEFAVLIGRGVEPSEVV